MIGYVGGGVSDKYRKGEGEGVGVNGGMMKGFGIWNGIDINLEVSGMGGEDKFEGRVGGKGYDGVLSGRVGLS